MARGLKLVVVDVGNTSTAVGVWTAGRVSSVRHCDGGFSEASGIVRALAADGVAGVAYVSVVPRADGRWRRFARSLGLGFHQVTYRDFEAFGRAAPLTLDYPEPQTIGADRLADAAGAVSRYGAPVLVMDFGTALTAAVVTADGVWRGGAIAPGFPLMRDYLFERTAQLPRLDLDRWRVPKVGRSTEEAMRLGAIVGYRGMVKELVSTLSSAMRTSFRLVATGGFARRALRGTGLPFTVDPTLTLYGAGLVASRFFGKETAK